MSAYGIFADEVHTTPGEPCPTCKRRVPVPKEDTAPRKRGQFNITVPKDAENGEAILRALIEDARELNSRPVGTPPYYILVDALYDYTTGGSHR